MWIDCNSWLSQWLALHIANAMYFNKTLHSNRCARSKIKKNAFHIEVKEKRNEIKWNEGIRIEISYLDWIEKEYYFLKVFQWHPIKDSDYETIELMQSPVKVIWIASSNNNNKCSGCCPSQSDKMVEILVKASNEGFWKCKIKRMKWNKTKKRTNRITKCKCRKYQSKMNGMCVAFQKLISDFANHFTGILLSQTKK